jgi:hypothetical protein
MVYWGSDFGGFCDVFMPYGAVVSIENLKGIAIGHANNKGKELQLEFDDFVGAPPAKRVRAAASS